MNRFKKLNKIQKRIIIILFLLLILVISLFAATNRNKDKESQAIVESEMLERYVLCSAPLDQTIINTINNPITIPIPARSCGERTLVDTEDFFPLVSVLNSLSLVDIS